MEESSEKPLKNPTEAAGINKLPNAKKPFVAGNLVKSVVFAVLACAALGGTFYLESSRVEGQAIVQENSSIINFDGEVDLKEKDGVYEVNSGHLWGDFSLSNARVNFWVGNVVLIPRNATFDLTVTDSKIDLAVYGGDVYVGFWPSEDLPLIALDQYDTGFINSLLVPQGNQIKIPLKKVSEDLRPLLPTKILKEFKYSVIPHSVQNSDWVKENKKDADRFVVSYKQSYRSKVLARGEVLSEGFLNQFISWSAGNLTFVPEKRNEVKIRSVFNDLDAAIFYAVDGDRQKMNQNLQSYRSAAASVLKEEGYLSQFENYLKDLTAFGPGDLEYLVLLVLLDMSGAGPYEVLDFYWYDVYRGIAQGQIEADKALDNYYQKYLSLVASDDPQYRVYLAYENQLFDNLFLGSSMFYRDGYFVMKEDFERALLGSYVQKKDKEELAQAFVARKIDFLKRLKKYFFEGDLEVLETKRIFKRLIGGARDLLPKDDDGGVAVIELFQNQLDDINDFWGYLNSPEYHSQLYGSSHEERYEAYLTERENIFSFVNIQEDVFGEVVEQELSVAEVMDEVLKALSVYDDLADLEIGEIDDPADRYIPVMAVLGGYPFQADFDRDTGSLKQVYVYDELVSDRLVKVDNLLALLQNKFADLADNSTEEEEITLETTAQRTARLYIARLVSEYGFDAEIENIAVFDDKSAIYRIEKVTYHGYEDIEVTFDLIMSGETVTHVFMTVDRKPRVVDGEFTLEEFAGLVEAEINFQEHGIKPPTKPSEEPAEEPEEEPQAEDVENASDVPIDIFIQE